MGRTRTLVDVPIEQMRCWDCAYLEQVNFLDYEEILILGYRCPQNVKLDSRMPPNFAEKCAHFRPKG